MSSVRGRRLAAAALLLLIAAPATVRAQEGERPRLEEELIGRLEQMREPLERAFARAREEQKALEAARRARAGTALDTLAVGPLRVVARPERADEARRLFTDVWREIEPIVGRSLDLSDAYFLYDPLSDLGAVALDRHHKISGRNWRNLAFSTELLERRARGAIRREIAHQGPASLLAWTQQRGPQSAREERRGDLYRQLVLTPSKAAARCVGGAGEGCWAALGLGLADDPSREWYSMEQLATTPVLANWLRCLETSHRALCRDFFGEAAWMDAIPFGPELRADLLGYALETGGAGSLGRLLSTVPDVESVDGFDRLPQRRFARGMRAGLAAASGLDGDELILRWRARLVDARPDVTKRAEETRTATFLWILFFTLFATRSSRWHLG